MRRLFIQGVGTTLKTGTCITDFSNDGFCHIYFLKLKFFSKNSNESNGQNKSTDKMTGQSKVDIEKIKNNILKNHNVTFEGQPSKSESDKKEYLVMKLDNGLKTLLISDVEHLLDLSKLAGPQDGVVGKEKVKPGTRSIYRGLKKKSSRGGVNEKISNKGEKLAACSLTVGTGSYSDPEEIPGLAHFLEHMLFMGSEKFPKENDFDSYISVRGGSSNAFTDRESTTFYFTCPDKHLCNVMDRFANFFISPLLKRDSMTREREIVDSEFLQNLFSDSARIEQLLCSTAPLNNPAHKFLWGNLITLKHNVKDDVLHNSLREFWKKYYTANHMTVAVQASLPMDVLGIWVAQYFGKIHTNNSPTVVFPSVEPPFKMDLFNKIYTVMPIEDRDQIQLTWAFPSVKQLYKSKPLSYLYFLFGHKGEGSLFSYIHEKLWVIDLNVGFDCNSPDNSIFSLFSITLTLTDKGLEKYEKIIESVFSYLKLLKNEGPSESIFKESQIIDELKFRYQHETEAFDNVVNLSENMQNYPTIDYITGDKLLFQYKPDDITEILELMTPKNVNIMIISKSQADQVKLDQTEFWFKTKYRSDNIPEKFLCRWNNCNIYSEFFLPKPNIYIPLNFNIIPINEDQPKYPKNIIMNEFMEVWHKPDDKFKLPYGVVVIYLISPIASAFPQNSVMCDIFRWLFSFLMIKEAYPASLAGLDFSLSSGPNGLIITIDGFNHQIPLLLKNLIEEMIELAKNKKIPQGLFEAIKNQLNKQYENNILDSSELSGELFSSILFTNYWGSLNELEAVYDVTIEKCQEFNASFFENLYIKCLIQGNISQEQAVDLICSVKQILDYKPLLTGTYPETRVRVIPKAHNIIRVQSFNKQDDSSDITNYYQCGFCSMKDHSLMLLLMLMMEEPLFSTLRTKEQLAYSASCNYRDNQGILGFSLTVLSHANKFSVEHVENRMSSFLKKFLIDFETVSTEEFERAKESMKILFLVYDTNLRDEVERNWMEIVYDKYLFDRVEAHVKEIETINQSHMNTFVKKILKDFEEDKANWKYCRKLSIQVDGENFSTVKDIPLPHSLTNAKGSLIIKNSNNVKQQHKFIENLENFKSGLYIFPYKIIKKYQSNKIIQNN